MSLDQEILTKIRDRQQLRDEKILPYWRKSVDALTFGDISIKWSPYIQEYRNGEIIPVYPTSKQLAALMLDDYLEVFFGGAAASGKSTLNLMQALQYTDDSEFNGIIFRRTLTAAGRSGGILDKAMNWLIPQGIYWDNKGSKFIFPSGATLSFGYFDSEFDYESYKGSEYQFISWEEADQFDEKWYEMLFDRLRKRDGCNIPLRMRSNANPGGRGHGWIKKRFNIQFDADRGIYRGFNPDRPYIPAFAWDNPHVNIETYVESMSHVDPIRREQMLMGNWVLSEDGRFKPSWFERRRYSTKGNYVFLEPEAKGQAYEIGKMRFFWTVDPATTAYEGPARTQVYRNVEPSNTAMGLWGLLDRYLLLWFVDCFSLETPEAVERIFKNYKHFEQLSIRPDFIACEAIGPGRVAYQLLERMRLPLRPLRNNAVDKVSLSTDAANRAYNGLLYLPYHSDPQAGNWLQRYEEEIFKWTGHKGQTDDQVDITSWAAIVVSTSFADSGLAFGPGQGPLVVPSGFNRLYQGGL